MTKVSSYIPKTGLALSKYTWVELIDRLWEEAIKDTVIAVLLWNNIRSLTESLTQRRITLSNASLLVTYLRASKSIPNFPKELLKTIKEEISAKGVSKEKKVFLQWFAWLTGKGVQNILRGDGDEELQDYMDRLEGTLLNSVEQSKAEYWDLEATIVLDKETYPIGWLSLIQIMMAVWSQTLAIRWAEKSMYWKLFEKLVIWSVLSILWFKLIKKDNTNETDHVFWLSERGDKRESDATLLFAPWKGIRFDIWFIWPWNTEISLDKVTRFDKEMQKGWNTHNMQTIILIDRIWAWSRIGDMAKEIGWHIIQMSMTKWVQELSSLLKEIFPDFDDKFSNLDDIGFQKLLKERMKDVDLRDFTK